MSIALITGASRGLGLATARALAERGWSLVIDARDADALSAARSTISASSAWAAQIVAIPGDVTNPSHREDLLAAARRFGHLDLLINNASLLGPSPQPELARYPLDQLTRVYAVDVVAPLALFQLARPLLTDNATVINISSDAAVEAYPGWGGYGSAKAALDHLSAVLAAEHPLLRVIAFDPGDMRTQMHQQAFPDEDIGDRPEPESVVPALLALLDRNVVSGRYKASDADAELVGTELKS